MRRWIAVVAVLLTVGTWFGTLYLLVVFGGEWLPGFVSGLLSMAPPIAVGLGWRWCARELPRRRAERVWFADLESEYGVSREELLAVSLGLEEHGWGAHEGGAPPAGAR